MKNLFYCLVALIMFGCTSDIKKDINYLWDNGNYNSFPQDESIGIGNISGIDSLKQKIEKLKPKEFSLDVYPYQFGPEYNLQGEQIENVHHKSNYWPLGFLTNYSFIEKLSLSSVCSFSFKINPDNNIRNLKLSSHSCGRVYPDEKINFGNLNKLESIHFKRFILSNDKLKGIGQINNLISITADDCEIDLKDLLYLKNNLRYLNLSNSKVLNWNLLSEFKKLEILYIANINNVILSKHENTKFLCELRNLRELSVKKNSINNLDCIKNNNQLERIYIQNTGVKEIPTFLQKNKNLEIIK